MKYVKSGIYCLFNVVTGKGYIGSATNLVNRKSKHFQSLRKGKHHSQKLQRSFNRYGETAFEFRRLMLCAKEHLLFYEQRFFDIAPAHLMSYNVLRIAGSHFGAKRSAETKAKISLGRKGKGLGWKHTSEHRAYMSAVMKGRVITPQARVKLSAALTGIRRSAETRARVSKANRLSGRWKNQFGAGNFQAKLTEADALLIKQKLSSGEKGADISREFNVSPATVSSIKHGTRWAHLREQNNPCNP